MPTTNSHALSYLKLDDSFTGQNGAQGVYFAHHIEGLRFEPCFTKFKLFDIATIMRGKKFFKVKEFGYKFCLMSEKNIQCGKFFLNISTGAWFCGVVVITSASHAEGREFEPRQNLLLDKIFLF